MAQNYSAGVRGRGGEGQFQAPPVGHEFPVSQVRSPSGGGRAQSQPLPPGGGTLAKEAASTYTR